MEGCAGLEHRVRALQHRREVLDVREGAVGRGMHVREVEHWANPIEPRRDRQHVVDRPELVHAPHHLDPERHAAALLLQPLAQLARLLDDVVERLLALAFEQEARGGRRRARRRQRGRSLPSGRASRSPCSASSRAPRARRSPRSAHGRRGRSRRRAPAPRAAPPTGSPSRTCPRSRSRRPSSRAPGGSRQPLPATRGRGSAPARIAARPCGDRSPPGMASDAVPTLSSWPSARPESICSSSTSTSA